MSANHDDFAALAQGYALGTLTDEEARTFASHLHDLRRVPAKCSRHGSGWRSAGPRAAAADAATRLARSRADPGHVTGGDGSARANQQPRREAACGTVGSRRPRPSWRP